MLAIFTTLGFKISIHAPREGGDKQKHWTFDEAMNFNPRPPRGGRHPQLRRGADQVHISIHAPREGGDSARSFSAIPPNNFNPRPPRGGRHSCTLSRYTSPSFQSTPPARGATVKDYHFAWDDPKISIHAPREGGDSKDAQFYLRIFDK